MAFNNPIIYCFALIAVLISAIANIAVNAQNCLQDCWNKQVKSLNGQYLRASYTEHFKELDHGFEPWESLSYIAEGTIWINNNNFLKSDTLTDSSKKNYRYSKTQVNSNDLLFMNYYETKISPVSRSVQKGLIFKSARYSPVFLINYFYKQNIPPDIEANDVFSSYTTTINKTVVKLYVNKSDCLLGKITTLNHDDLYGDVATTYIYKNYAMINKLTYPSLIYIEKMNGKLKDTVAIHTSNVVTPINILEKPIDYKVTEMDENPLLNTSVDKYSENIYFVELTHTDSRVMIVEFLDYLLVAGAPLNSENGEIIIREAKEIAPDKPIKYFVFGHHHPYYVGGIRAFIHQGATVLSRKQNSGYVKYLADAPHTLNPDSLELDPKTLRIEEIEERKFINDGHFEMQIYFIGNKSCHTNDYLIFYFPSLKLLYQDDLVRINQDGKVTKAGARQAGLYNAVKGLGLNVETIVQSWPLKEHSIKTIIPFQDLEKSVNYAD